VKRIGLIVNPLAGIGGRVGLKGSDGSAVQQRAFTLGAHPEAMARAALSLLSLLNFGEDLEILSFPLEMGESSVCQAGFTPTVCGEIQTGQTTAEDTRRAAQEFIAFGVDLLLFAGGDGTARDLSSSIPPLFPCLGIPAGVKIHSAVYAVSPRHAGELAKLYLAGKAHLHESEVVDLDEDAYREGRVSTCLFGYLNVPFYPFLVQNQKAPSPASEAYQVDSIAADVVEQMQAGVAYILGPGTTTRAVARRLNLEKTLVGVDVIRDGRLILKDAAEADLLNLLESTPARIIVTPIGGQGFLFGRGNQPIAPEVIRKVGREGIIVISTPGKLRALAGQPFLVDTGDARLDALLAGYCKVITGYQEQAIYKIIS
jgi:predicted polyphosphate/ATP-dependent NAD kinase